MKKILIYLLLIIGVVEGNNTCNLSNYKKEDLYIPTIITLAEGTICKEKNLNMVYCYKYNKSILKMEDIFYTKIEKFDKKILKNVKECIISKKITISLLNCKIKVNDTYNNSIDYNSKADNGLLLFGNDAKEKCFNNKHIIIP